MANNQSLYQGSPTTYHMVSSQIAERWGKEEAENYDPYSNCFTIRQWNKMGFRVKPGEHSLHSITFIEEKDKDGNVIGKYPKTVHLFYILQVQEVKY